MVSIVNKQRGANKIAHPLFYSALPSLLSLLYTVLNLPVGVIPVGQVVQIGIHPASVYVVTSGTKTPDIKKLRNALLAGAAIGLVGVLLAVASEKFNVVDHRSRHVPKPLLLLNYSFTPAPTAAVAID